MVPSLGILPLVGIGEAIKLIADPVEEPERYAEILGEAAQALPFIQFQQGGLLSRVAGGGNFGNAVSITEDIFGAISGRAPIDLFTEEFGDVNRPLIINRELSVAMSDPEFMEQLSSALTNEEAELLLMSAVNDANRAGSISHGAKTAVRGLSPVNADFDDASHELQELWIGAAETNPALTPENFDPDATNEVELRRMASDIRALYFGLPGWERQLALVSNPELVVNIVPTYVWTERAVDRQLVDNVLTPYRGTGTTESLKQLEIFVKQGYLRPMRPEMRARIIVGTLREAQFGSLETAYSRQAALINQKHWDVTVSDRTKGHLLFLLDQYGEQLGMSTAKEVWEHFSTMQGFALADAVEELDLVIGTAAYDRIKTALNIPGDEQAWGTTWRGDDYSDFSARFRDWPIFDFAPETQAIADAMGLDLGRGMSGANFLKELIDAKAEFNDSIWSAIRPEFASWRGSRISTSEADGMLRDLETREGLTEGFAGQVSEFRTFVQLKMDSAFSQSGDVPLSVQTEVVDRFERLAAVAPTTLDWDDVWSLGFERTFGPREWDPPQPRPVFKDDGQFAPGAFAPFVQGVLDGSTLEVSMEDSITLPIFGDVGGIPRHFRVHILGVPTVQNGADIKTATEQRKRLVDAISDGIARGDRIYLVRDFDFYGSDVDAHGQLVAWLYIGDEPYWFEDEMRRGS